LDQTGIRQASMLKHRLAKMNELDRLKVGRVFCSSLSRARQTCSLAGYDKAEIRDELVEWDYGAYEGKTTAEIQAMHPGWSLWNDGVEKGESLGEVGKRVDTILNEIRREVTSERTLIFGHAHCLRILCARWLGLAPVNGRLFTLSTASISKLGYERGTPVILSWNETSPVTSA
jgi:probable phosphoglycerate mutase